MGKLCCTDIEKCTKPPPMHWETDPGCGGFRSSSHAASGYLHGAMKECNDKDKRKRRHSHTSAFRDNKGFRHSSSSLSSAPPTSTVGSDENNGDANRRASKSNPESFQTCSTSTPTSTSLPESDISLTNAHNSSTSSLASRSRPESGVALDVGASKSPLKHQMSHEFFSEPDQTVIIFDWDDTLFPSTWLRDTKPDVMKVSCEKLMQDPNNTFAESMYQLALSVSEVLVKAQKLSKNLAIVTLAKEGWVQIAIRLFMPSLQTLIDDFQISILYALPLAQAAGIPPPPPDGFQTPEEEVQYWTQVKGSAVESVCTKCYSQYPGQTWKNVMSIGDSIFEHLGTRDAIKRWSQANCHTAYQLPRAKTLKMMEKPTCAELTHQLELLSSWLPTLVKREQGFNIDFGLIEQEAVDVGEQLKSNQREGPSLVIHQGYLWKLTSDGDPLREEDWVKRRVLLSPGGELWYESLEKGQALQCFHNTLVDALQVTRLVPRVEATQTIKGEAIYAFKIEKCACTEKSSSSIFLAATSMPMQDAWIQNIASFKRKMQQKFEKTDRNSQEGVAKAANFYGG